MSNFFGSPAIISRSIFTNRGPIAKPPTFLVGGTGATITYANRVNIPGGSFTPSDVGLTLRLTGGGPNDGDYPVTSVISPTSLKILASLSIPDGFSYGWVLISENHGEIASEPSDVTVTINGSPVTPTAVDGLRGQIVLASVPSSTDTVTVDYRFIERPTVNAFLNEPAFTLNSGVRNPNNRRHSSYFSGGRAYPYAVVLSDPSKFGRSSLLGPSPQPLLRNVHYRGYERRYTATLNDASLLTLNTPTNRIAYPPKTRDTLPVSVNYQAASVPHLEGWSEVGSGLSSVAGGILTATDNTTGTFPAAQPHFWTRSVDLSFPHAFALAWRMRVSSVPTTEGIWTGISVGWAAQKGKVFLVGFLEVAGIPKIGVLKAGYGNSPETTDAWEGLIDNDSSIIRTYRAVRSSSGVYSIFRDGDIVPLFTVHESSLPDLSELTGPFQEIQTVFFGSLSRPASSVSLWEFVRYESLPSTFTETFISSFVSYEANATPENATPPWLLLGHHGQEEILSGDTLRLSSVVCTPVSGTGVVTGGFRSFLRLEPLLSSSVDTVLDVFLTGREFTTGSSHESLFAAIYDGSRFTSLSFLSAVSSPSLSYAGETLPEDYPGGPFTRLGGGFDPSNLSVTMEGSFLRLKDNSNTDGIVYTVQDSEGPSSESRILAPSLSYKAEARITVFSFTTDLSDFAGVSFDVFDGTPLSPGRPVGIGLYVIGGSASVGLHRDGFILHTEPFAWDDQSPHTYKVVKDVAGDLLSVFADGSLLFTYTYSSITTTPGNGTFSFGSVTASSVAANSDVLWEYANLWREKSLPSDLYVGFWNGRSTNSLLDFHLPIKISGTGTTQGNTLYDNTVDFTTFDIVVGDRVTVPNGPNQGVYVISNITPNALVFGPPTPFPLLNASTPYAVVRSVDWTEPHKYRVVRNPSGGVSVSLDADLPMINVGYDQIPTNSGKVGIASGGIPAVAFGSLGGGFVRSDWDYVRFGAKSVPDASRAVSRLQRLNQRNVMASPEHLRTDIPHNHTNYWSSSTGIPPQSGDASVDLHRNPSLVAYTHLREGVPPVPLTQSLNNRNPSPTSVPLYGLNNPENVLNSLGFLLNDASVKVSVIIPPDVWYNCLEIIERTEGDTTDLITPVVDLNGLAKMNLFTLTKTVCFSYNGDVLPEFDPSASTPWTLISDNPGEVITTINSGALEYLTLGSTTRYSNPTPLLITKAHPLRVVWTVTVLSDTSFGISDTEIRLGFASKSFSVNLAFLSDTTTGVRSVAVKDSATGKILAGLPFDFLDNQPHDYALTVNLGQNPSLTFEID